MKTPSLADELLKYENKWVAISQPDEKVVGSGADAYEANLDAEKNGYTEAVLLLVPSFDSGYAPNS